MARRIETAVVIPTLHSSLNELREIPDDLRLIRTREGLGLTCLARSFGVSKQALWKWQQGESTPNEPLVILAIKSWAKQLRENGGAVENKGNHNPDSDVIIVRPERHTGTGR